jgi:hypothetical protein
MKGVSNSNKGQIIVYPGTSLTSSGGVDSSGGIASGRSDITMNFPAPVTFPIHTTRSSQGVISAESLVSFKDRGLMRRKFLNQIQGP